MPVFAGRKGPKMPRIRSISIFGDSILRGVVLNTETRRYSVSDCIGIDSIADMYSIEITNHSRFGCTIERSYEYIRKHLARSGRADAVLLELGGNDCDFNWAEVAARPDAEHFPRTPIERFVSVYKAIIDTLRKQGIIPVLSNLPPLCPERYLDWVCRDGLDRERIRGWLGSITAIYRFQENYSRTVDCIAEEAGCKCIDLRGAFLRHRRVEQFFCEDGIHPNYAGQGLIRGALIDTLNNYKGVIYA